MYHIERDVLLGIIPTVKPTSAKPIRKIICDELDETKIMHLVQDHWLWKYRESKGEEGRGPRPLSEIIQEARTKHLENLRRVEFDIDTEGVRKEDWWFHQQLRRAVESTVRQVNFYNEGGADDYRVSLNKYRLAFSVIARLTDLKALIDGDLCRDWNITVKDNMEKQQCEQGIQASLWSKPSRASTHIAIMSHKGASECFQSPSRNGLSSRNPTLYILP